MTNMASPRIGSCLLLLLAVLCASARSAVGGQSKQEGILPAATPELTTLRTVTKTTKSGSDDVMQIEILESEEDTKRQGGTDDDEKEEERRKEESKEEENEEEGNEEEEEYDGGINNNDDDDDDEYEDELKQVAESHEAMSKDEARSLNVTSVKNVQSREELTSAQNFDSHEKSDESAFDESIMSNEAIISETIKKAQDEEVTELLKYKMRESARAKVKRVPTVKKELSTQKEILLASNETQVSKSLLPSEDPVNGLNDETDNVRRRALEKNELIDEKSREGVYLQRSPGEIGFNNTYGEEKIPSTGVKRLDKRQETVLKDLKAYLLAENAAEEERQRKLEELGVQEDALAESLLKLLVKLAEDPGKWQRVHKFLTDTGDDLEVSQTQDSMKRGTTSTASFSVTTPPNDAPKKNRKNPKKKKKKRPRHHQTSTITSTMTPIPETSPLTPTDTWLTTSQWRLVAERLFGPRWHENRQEESENTAKMRIDPKPRALSSLWDLVDQNKSKNILKTMNTEQKPLLSDASGKSNTQSRLLAMRNINSHPLYLQDSRKFTPVTDSYRLPDYDSSQAVFPHPRYISTSEFPQRRNQNDYQDDLTLQTNYFAHNQEYKPPSREFAISRSWPDLTNPYKHDRPWRLNDERPLFPIPSDRWPWNQQSDFRYWPVRGKYRSRWTPLEIEKNDDRSMDLGIKDWQQRESPFWKTGKSHMWLVEEMPPLWPQIDKTMKSYGHDELTTWQKNKNHSELNKKEGTSNKVVLPKITMKTWNSLTSDPATWPYKLPSAKPWPKDENGKSYNPNADLIKKLGLDKENDANWSKGKDEKSGKLVFEKQTSSSYDKDARKKELTQLNDLKYKPISNKSNYNDYEKLQPQESMKEMPKWMYQNMKQTREWTKPQGTSDSLENGEMDTWNTNSADVSAGNPWLRKNSQSAILSTTQLADGSQARFPNDENPSFSRFSPFDTASTKEQKWLDKSTEGLIKYWTYSAKNSSSPSAKVSGDDFWRENNSWMPKTKENLWAKGMKSAPISWGPKVGDNIPWASKADNNASWMPKSSNVDSWTTDGNNWPGKPNSVDSWSPSPNGLPPWITKGKSKDSWAEKPHNDGWSRKMKDDNFWMSKLNNIASWKNNNNNNNNNENWRTEQSAWQQKMNDDWSINYGKNTGSTWPSKWKQFAYHKVTAVPSLKPGTTADVSSAKSKNAFIAVSAVSSANYDGNDWRKDDVREGTRDDNFRPEKAGQLSNQVRLESERPIYEWKKNGLQLNDIQVKRNVTDPLESQLEALRQDDLWPYKQNEVETDEVFTTTLNPQSAITANNTTTFQLPQNQTTSKTVNAPSQAYQQELLMK